MIVRVIDSHINSWKEFYYDGDTIQHGLTMDHIKFKTQRHFLFAMHGFI